MTTTDTYLCVRYSMESLEGGQRSLPRMSDISALWICVLKIWTFTSGLRRSFLSRQIRLSDDIYSVFDVDVFRSGLFAYPRVNEEHTCASNLTSELSCGNATYPKTETSI